MKTKLKIHLRAAVLAVTLAATGGTTQAQGIPVIDIQGLIQAVLEVLNSITELENQVRQIEQLGSQVDAITGARNLGDILNSPLLHNYVPADAAQIVQAVETRGYSGLSGSAKALRDAQMVYNCMDQTGQNRARCQASLAHPYQNKAFMQDAMNSAKSRIDQIESLMQQINATQDQKAVSEIQARLEAEAAMLQHEQSKVVMATGMADAERAILESRYREAQLEQASRTGRLVDYVPR